MKEQFQGGTKLTILLTCNSDFENLGGEIRNGKIVIFPTDTVYGLGTDPRSTLGVERCYKIKIRDRAKKMPVLVSSLEVAKRLVKFGATSMALASAFWPGKLSLILPVKDAGLPAELVGSDRSLAVRVPNHKCCQSLISACGGCLIGTSANISGEEPLTNPEDSRLIELSMQVDYFVRGSCGEGAGLSSTVVDATSENSIKVVREGALSKDVVLGYLEKISRTDFSPSAI